MFKKYKKIILVITIAIILFFVYLYFTGGKNDSDLIKSTSGVSTGAEAIGSDIIQALNQIETLQLDKTIFRDPVYMSLVDRNQPLTPEPVGRDNPFLPLSTSVTTQTTLEIPTQGGITNPTTPR